MEQNSTGSITETCCWRRSCYQRSAALLKTCLSSSKTMRQHIVLLAESSFCAWDTTVHQSLWQANSPDLNAVDYRVWGMLQRRAYRVPILNMDELRKRLVATWAEFQQSVVDYAVDQWRKRLEACIRAEGGQFEHLTPACLTLQFSHITTGSFQSHQRLEQRNITFSRMKKFCILQGNVVTFFRCGG